MEIGTLLKKIRLEKQYTLNYVAEKLNNSVSLLSQIENGKTTPSMQSLESLLKFYAIKFSDFFRQLEQKKYIIVKKSDTEALINAEHGFSMTLLASKLENNTLETFIVELATGAFVETAILGQEINGERVIYVMEGSIEITIDENNSYTMETGDSVNFKSYVSCNIKNHGAGKSIFLISGIPPLFF